jgi:hypothetical protein
MRSTRRLALAWLLMLVVALAACGGTRSPSQGVASLSPSQVATASPSTLPSPVAVNPSPQNYGLPPAGVDLFYVTVPGWPTYLVGYDWQGNPRATIHLKELDSSARAPDGISVAPNGQAFESGAYTFDRLGRVVYQYEPAGKGLRVNTWSEDGAMLCGIEEAVHPNASSDGTGTTDFYFVRRAVSGPPVRVARFLHLDAIPGDMGYSSVACSHRLDRALLIQTVCCGIASAMAIRISDGTLLGTWKRDAGSPIFSPDGQLVADPTNAPGGTLPVSTIVRTIPGGTILARYGQGITFKALSGNNQLAVVSGDGRGGSQTRVIELTTTRQLWQDSTGRSLRAAWARPGSGDMALAFPASTTQVPCPSGQTGMCADPESVVVVVHPDGSATALRGVFELPWPILA